MITLIERLSDITSAEFTVYREVYNSSDNDSHDKHYITQTLQIRPPSRPLHNITGHPIRPLNHAKFCGALPDIIKHKIHEKSNEDVSSSSTTMFSIG